MNIKATEERGVGSRWQMETCMKWAFLESRSYSNSSCPEAAWRSDDRDSSEPSVSGWTLGSCFRDAGMDNDLEPFRFYQPAQDLK